jgi:hypothetical protein
MDGGRDGEMKGPKAAFFFLLLGPLLCSCAGVLEVLPPKPAPSRVDAAPTTFTPSPSFQCDLSVTFDRPVTPEEREAFSKKYEGEWRWYEGAGQVILRERSKFAELGNGIAGRMKKEPHVKNVTRCLTFGFE